MGKKKNTEPAADVFTVGKLADYLSEKGLRVHLDGNPDTRVSRVNTLEDSEQGDITFLANRKYIKYINQTQASAIILPETVSGPETLAQLKVDDSYYAFCLIVELIHGHRKHPFTGIDSDAKIDKTAKIGLNALIANGVTIAKNVTIGDNAVIYPGSFIGPNCVVGDNLILYPNVTVYDDTVIGNNVTIHSGTVVGEDGFGYATHKGIHHKIPQIGNVIIEDDVELGANCSIDRAAMGSTIIGKGTKTSNLIAIGHGSAVGPHCLLVAQVGIAGSTKLGHHVVLGGQVGVVGHISIGNCVTVGAKSGVINNVNDGETLLGQPAVPIQDAKRQMLMAGKLPEMRNQLKQLQKRIDQLEQQLTQTGQRPDLLGGSPNKTKA
jgi:UDP-3-O-[3-hydroxymyristoyl] glucosamine N-acyltransferase